MDFQSLSRRELQTLCKKNKIPANITNIAMIDALNALEIVEGIEELLKPSESDTAQSSIESPERTAITSPAVPRTGGRTSTRRKAIKEEPESSQIGTRTRRVTRRTLASDVEEAKVDVPESPAMATGTRKRVPVASARREVEIQLKEGEEGQKNGDQMVHEKKDVPETPAAPSGRRRGTVASAPRKIETDLGKEKGSSVLRVYSTRRSVRMSEKKMEESNEKQEERKDEVSENTGMSGFDMQKVSEEAFGDDQEHKGDSYQVDDLNEIHEEISEVLDEMVVTSVSAEHPNKFKIEKDRDVEDEVHDESKDDNSESKSEVGSKKCNNFDELDILSGEKFQALDMNDEVPETKGADDSTIDKFQSVTENRNKLLKENQEELNAGKDVESEDSATMVFPPVNVCGDVVDLAAPQSSVNVVFDLTSEVSARVDLGVFNFSASAADQDQNQDTDLEFASGEQFKGEAFSDDDAESDPNFHGARDLELKLATKEESNGKVSKDDSGAHSEISECLFGSKQLDSGEEPETPQILDQEESRNSSDQFDMKSNNASDVFSGEMEVANVYEAPLDVHEIAARIDAKEQPLPQMEAGADVHEAIAEVPAMTTHTCPPTLIGTPASENQNSYSQYLISEEIATDQIVSQGSMNFAYCHTEDPTPDVYEIASHESDVTTNEHDSILLDKTSGASVKQCSLSCTSSEKTVGSPVPDVDPYPGQISLTFCESESDSDHIPPLASLTPGKKSSSKTPTRSRRMMTHVLDENKENIDNSGRKLDLVREKGKKNKNTTAEDNQVKKSLNDASLRQLTKMLKEKLQITNEVNNYEEKSSSTYMAASARTALQTLPENRMRIGEPEREI